MVSEKLNEYISSGHDLGNLLNEDRIQETADYYVSEMQKRMAGPQLEALEKAWLVDMLRDGDPGVLLVDIQEDPEREKLQWPLLTPIRRHEGYDPQFFEKHFPGRNVLYFECPPGANLDTLLRDAETCEGIIDHILRLDAAVVYDFRVGDQLGEFAPEFLRHVAESKKVVVADKTPHDVAFGVDYGLPVGVYYEGRAVLMNPPDNPAANIQEAIKSKTTILEEGREHLLALPENGATLLNPEYLKDEKIQQQLWDMYLKQFENLGSDHPLFTHSPREEFIAMLSDPEAINVAAMEDGNIVGFLYFVNSIDKCVWLNPRYYNEKYGSDDAWVGFVPGIVVAEGKARQGLGHAQAMMRIAGEVIVDAGKDFVIAFGCTGASKTYIPKAVQNFLEGDLLRGEPGVAGLKLILDERNRGFKVTAEYEYHVLEFYPEPKG